MINLNGITVRLGGRTILDRATSALPPRAKRVLLATYMPSRDGRPLCVVSRTAVPIS